MDAAIAIGKRLARERLSSFIREAKHILAGEVAYSDASAALEKLTKTAEQLRQTIEDADQQDTLALASAAGLKMVTERLPYLGMLLRSTNVRNCFELYNPLKMLTKEILKSYLPAGAEVQLVISSEWNYSPFTYAYETKDTELGQFVFLGFPASESQNPLIVPLAGHEIGHSLWKVASGVSQSISSELTKRIFLPSRPGYKEDCEQIGDPSTLPGRLAWFFVLSNALRQAEEIFCDCIGIGVFAESYFHAFSYLFSHLKARRSEMYPDLNVRANLMAEFANNFGVTVPTDFSKYCGHLDASFLNVVEKRRLKIADEAISAVRQQVFDAAKHEIPPLREKRHEAVKEIVECFRKLYPSNQAEFLVDIVNAGWHAELQGLDHFWDRTLKGDRRLILHELVIINIQVLDFKSMPTKKDGDGAA